MVIVLLPLVGWLLNKVQARWLIGFGFLVSSLALWHMSSIYLGIDFRTAVMYRIYQSIGLAFLFVPINTIAYLGVPPEKNNQISAMTNLARNIGGSVGISVATSLIVRRSQIHQTNLVSHATPYDPTYREALAALTAKLTAAGSDAVDATKQATARLYGMILREATTMAYIDVIWLMAIVTACMLPFVFLLRRNPPGSAMAH
jgi:DHA2 family multidrug resistance protein